MNMAQDIKDVIENICPLLELDDEKPWLLILKKWHDEIDDFPNETVRDIIRSSMGPLSLGDLFIYKNGELLYKETLECDVLVKKLFNLCVESLPEVSKNDPMAGEHSDS